MDEFSLETSGPRREMADFTLRHLDKILLSMPVRSCFVKAQCKQSVRAHILEDIQEELATPRKKTKDGNPTKEAESKAARDLTIAELLDELSGPRPTMTKIADETFRVIDISDFRIHDSKRYRMCGEALHEKMQFTLNLACTATERQALLKLASCKDIEAVEELLGNLYATKTPSASDRYLRTAINCFSNLWSVGDAHNANNECWWQANLYSQVFDRCFLRAKDYLTKRSEILSMTLKTAKLEGFKVPSHRVDFVVSCKDYDMDLLTSEDKPTSSSKVNKDTDKGLLIQQTTLGLWRKKIGAQRKELLSELEAITCQWIGNELVVRGTRLLGSTFVHYKKAVVRFPTTLRCASAALALSVVMSLERTITLNFRKMELILEEKASQQISDLQLASDYDATCAFFAADEEACLKEVRQLTHPTDVLTGAKNWQQLKRLEQQERENLNE
ncbi:hypothetical protein BGX20_001252 [Mortierella sp. AD010]|nr:hypothetical protein BGX20_001252 [Mortierella sp. AD010]